MSLSQIIPMLPVANMPASVEFYIKLGFSVCNRNDEWGWAMLQCGDSKLMIDQSIHLHKGIPKTSVTYLYAKDLEAFHRQAKANGLNVPDLDETFYNMTEFRMEDLDGNHLWIGKAV